MCLKANSISQQPRPSGALGPTHPLAAPAKAPAPPPPRGPGRSPARGAAGPCAPPSGASAAPGRAPPPAAAAPARPPAPGAPRPPGRAPPPPAPAAAPGGGGARVRASCARGRGAGRLRHAPGAGLAAGEGARGAGEKVSGGGGRSAGRRGEGRREEPLALDPVPHLRGPRGTSRQVRGPRSPRRSRPRSRPRGATAAGAERSPRNPPARPAPPNFRPKGRVRRARCAWRGHNFLSPSEAAGARQLPGRGRTSEGPRPAPTSLQERGAARRARRQRSSFQRCLCAVVAGGRRVPEAHGGGRVRTLALAPAAPRAGSSSPPGRCARPHLPRAPGSHLRVGAGPVTWSRGSRRRLCARLSPRPELRHYSMPGGRSARDAGTRGLGRSERWTRGRPGVRRLRLPPRTSGRFLSPRPPTSGGSPRAPSGALIRSR